jgi:hypothetical protein
MSTHLQGPSHQNVNTQCTEFFGHMQFKGGRADWSRKTRKTSLKDCPRPASRLDSRDALRVAGTVLVRSGRFTKAV